jgi:hypothetical protein
MSQKIETCILQQDCGGKKFDNAGNNIYVSVIPLIQKSGTAGAVHSSRH